MFALAVVFQSLLDLDLIFGNMLSKYLLELPNSRTQEVGGDSQPLECFFSPHDWWHLSADLIGLQLMSRACYDPRAAPE